MASLARDLAGEGVQIVWQTGKEEFERLRASFGGLSERIKMYPFIDNMEYAYAACDLAVCRSGASSIAELTRAGVPSVLIPYPHAAADHQTENARSVAAAGAGVLLPDGQAGNSLGETVKQLLGDRKRLAAMAAAARLLGKPGAAGVLADAVEQLAGVN
jgi:UDP-N-acetylglucosamine--N-acetylmuramyl-(pentapeptide) pyrophosphoryl-undecaprenol N-acetylglucosamine transferase